MQSVGSNRLCVMENKLFPSKLKYNNYLELIGTFIFRSSSCPCPFKLYIYIYRVFQNDWSGFEVDYIHKYGEQNYKYW